MSVTAEASKTAFEIYQPVIVGLGAVILGFLANGFLEIWKSRIAERKEQNKIRKAIFSELKKFLPIWQSSSEFVDGELGSRVTFVKFSGYLDAIKPDLFSELTSEEITAVVNVITLQDGALHFLRLQGCDPSEDRFFRCAEGDNIADFDGIVTHTKNLLALTEVAIKLIEKRM